MGTLQPPDRLQTPALTDRCRAYQADMDTADDARTDLSDQLRFGRLPSAWKLT
jgi:hypothetical protein